MFLNNKEIDIETGKEFINERNFFHTAYEKPFISLSEAVLVHSLWELLGRTTSKRQRDSLTRKFFSHYMRKTIHSFHIRAFPAFALQTARSKHD